MLSSIISATGLTLQNTLFCTAASIGLGLLLAGSYLLQGNHTKNFTVSLVMLPLLVQAVIMMVNGNIGTGVAVMGAFSLIRFRSFPGSSRDITAIFAAMSVGIATGMGFLGFALIIAIVFATLSVILSKISLKGKETADRELKITIPETLNYTEVFTDILDNYTKNASLEKVRTTNMGSMYEITYLISLKASNTEKQLIDELRCRNGNLPIILHRAQTAKDEL